MGNPEGNPKHKLCHEGIKHYRNKEYVAAEKAWIEALPDEDAQYNLDKMHSQGLP
jgi:hypothetical protein